MGTPIFGFYFPDDSTPNDLHTFFLNLASGIETEMSRQGTLEARPSPGTQGRLYWATTRVDPISSSAVPWRVLYRDDGTTWQQINPSARQAWNPSFSTEGSPNYNINVTSTDAYYSVFGNRCKLSVACLIGLTGGPASGGGIVMSLPVPSAVLQHPLQADLQNDVARAVITLTNSASLYTSGANARFLTDGTARYFRVAGEYWIS